MDFYRNILFVFPKEKCLPATFVDLQKKSNSSRDSNSVEYCIRVNRCYWDMSSLYWNSQSFVSVATTKGKEQILFHSNAWWGLRFQCACSTLKYVTALFRQILTDAERKTMDISIVVNCTKKRLETVELITTQCRQNKLFLSFETAQTWILIKSALRYVIAISCSLLNFYRSGGK